MRSTTPVTVSDPEFPLLVRTVMVRPTSSCGRASAPRRGSPRSHRGDERAASPRGV